ncbi:MarR family winged helix-turn-helix transcriptional regulator [Paraglaciecola aestuariivivens]
MQSQNLQQLELNQFVPYRLVNLANKMSQGLSKIYKQSFDISIAEWRVLAQLAQQHKLCAKEVGEITAMDKSKVSRAVKLLQQKGLLSKQTKEQDNRTVYLSLSEQGTELYQQIVPKALEWEAKLFDDLAKDDRQSLLNLINKLDSSILALDLNNKN